MRQEDLWDESWEDLRKDWRNKQLVGTCVLNCVVSLCEEWLIFSNGVICVICLMSRWVQQYLFYYLLKQLTEVNNNLIRILYITLNHQPPHNNEQLLPNHHYHSYLTNCICILYLLGNELHCLPKIQKLKSMFVVYCFHRPNVVTCLKRESYCLMEHLLFVALFSVNVPEVNR